MDEVLDFSIKVFDRSVSLSIKHKTCNSGQVVFDGFGNSFEFFHIRLHCINTLVLKIFTGTQVRSCESLFKIHS